MRKKLLIDLIGVLLIALIVVLGYKLSPVLLPKADVVLQPDGSCDLLRQDCGLELPGGGRMQFSLGGKPVPLVKPFPIAVTLVGSEAERVEVDFDGVDMKMGFNRPQLQRTAPGVFAGDATLPVCITGGMVWQATVLIERGRERIAVPFLFDTGRSH